MRFRSERATSRLLPPAIAGAVLIAVATPATTQPPPPALLPNLVKQPCNQSKEAVSALRAEVASRWRGTAFEIVLANGQVVYRSYQHFGEDDSLAVIVVADRELLPSLVVVRVSPQRIPGSVSIVGAEPTAIATATPADRCDWRPFLLANFAPGSGSYAIQAIWIADDAPGKFARIEVGKGELPVGRSYSGALSFGPILTRLPDPEFVARVAGSDTVIAQSRGDGTRGQYGLFLSFFTKRRHLGKTPVMLSPTIGIPLEGLPNSLLFGLALDYRSSVFLLVGGHSGRVRELDPASGLSVGSKASGGDAGLPVVTKWKLKPFVGVGFDLRAVATLFGYVAKAAGLGG